MSSSTEKAIFAAGCFWGVQYYFDEVPGVVSTEVGYIGGNVVEPTYEAVCYENTGHAEALSIAYDPKIISYEKLLKHFFRMHDPTQLNRQGPDVGDQYRSAIFYMNMPQKALAEKEIDFQNTSGNFSVPVVTTLEKATKFWPAESYHQKFSARTGIGMCHIPYKSV